MNRVKLSNLASKFSGAIACAESSITGKTVFAFIGAAGLVLLACQLLRHYAFETPAYDLRIHEELVRNSLRGRWLYSDLLGHGFLGHHVPLIFVLVSPLYALWPGPVCLLVLQGILVMLGAWFLWRCTVHMRLRPLVSLALLCTFLTFRAVHSSYFRGFQQEVLAMVFLLGFLSSVMERRALPAAVWGILALSCREDVALFLIPVGLALCFRRSTLAWGVSVLSVAIAWCLCAYLWIIPSHAVGGRMAGFGRWQQYGDSFPAIARHLCTHPRELLSHVFNTEALRLPGSLFFLPLLDGTTVAAIALPWIVCTTSSFPQQAQLHGAYAALFVPFMFIGAVRVLSHRLPMAFLSNGCYALVFSVLLVGVNMRMYPLPGNLAGARAAHRELAIVRKGVREASVLAQGCIVPHIGWPESCDMIGSPRAKAPDAYDIVLLAPGKDPWPLKTTDIETHIEVLSASPAWTHRQAGCIHIFMRNPGPR